jgi:RNA 2',3'-cyclic 3'-phosphodiesterase
MPRLFVGIPIKDNCTIILRCNELQAKLNQSKIAWVHADNFHLTLKFLGNVEAYNINSISIVLEEVQKKFHSFTMELNALNYFGTKDRPTVIMFQVVHHPILCALQKNIDEALARIGFEIEKRKFNPHLTIARVKSLVEKEAFSNIMDTQQLVKHNVVVRNFKLFESILRQEGPEYKELQVFNLEE